MQQTRFSTLAAVAVLLVATGGTQTALAQAYSYPSMQTPTVSNRDYTAAIVASKGTVALFQWREGINDNMHFTVDAGLGDPEGRDNNLIVFGGGALAAQLLRASGDQPLDLLLTGGFGVALGAGQTTVRMPIGVSVGHHFDFGDGVGLTPYVHPRISLDICSSCSSRNNNNSELSLNFDIGLNFQVNPKFALRVAGTFSGSDLVGRNDAIAFGINWTPMPLLKR